MKHLSEEHKRNISESHKGKKLSAEHVRALSISHKGYKMPEEQKKKISEGAKRVGSGKWMKGRPHSEEFKKQMSEKMKGNKHWNWQGGRSKQLWNYSYGDGWTRTLRRSIRERDNYTCRLCGAQQVEEAFHVHHIDYDKNNHNPDNLITLCHRCHMRTNSNKDRWRRYFEVDR
jgi:hypothetical protein